MIVTFRDDCVFSLSTGGNSIPLVTYLPYVPTIVKQLGASAEVGELVQLIGHFSHRDGGSRGPMETRVKAIEAKYLPPYQQARESDTVVMSQYAGLNYNWVFGVRADCLERVREVVTWVDGWKYLPSSLNTYYAQAQYEQWLRTWEALIWALDHKAGLVGESVEVLPMQSIGVDFNVLLSQYLSKFNLLLDRQTNTLKDYKKKKQAVLAGLLDGLLPAKASYARRILGA